MAFTLPKDSKELALAIENSVASSRTASAWWRLSRLLYLGSLNGATSCSRFDWVNGIIDLEYPSSLPGASTYKHQRLLHDVETNISRLVSQNWAPLVLRQGHALTAIRERAIAQVIADAVSSNDQLDALKRPVSFYLTVFGCVGIHSETEIGAATAGQAKVRRSVINPLEMFPWPAAGAFDLTKHQGFVWSRRVPLEWLEMRLKSLDIKMPPGSELEIEEVAYGEYPTSIPSGVFGGAASPVGGATFSFVPASNSPGRGFASRQEAAQTPLGASRKGGDSDRKSTLKLVRINEVWIESDPGILEQYVLTSGQTTIIHRDYSEVPGITYTPVSWGRAIETGSFWGAGLCDKLYPINRQIERLFQKLLNNVETRDDYGITLIPRGTIDIERNLHKTPVPGWKVFTVERDPFPQEPFRVETIQPLNSGELPAGVIQLFSAALREMQTPDTMMGDAPGRVDSAQALQLLDDQAQRSFGGLSFAIRNLIGHSHRVATAQAIRLFRGGPFGSPVEGSPAGPIPIPITRLDSSLAGLVFDPVSGTARIGAGSGNPEPNLATLVFTIREASPTPPSIKKAEALKALELGLHTPSQYKALALREGWDVGVFMDHEEAAKRTIDRHILILYNDGNRPGRIVPNRYAAMPSFQLMLLNIFMASPEFEAASFLVKNEIIRYQVALMALAGGLPDGYPDPDAVAVAQSAMAAGMDPLKAVGAGRPPEPIGQPVVPGMSDLLGGAPGAPGGVPGAAPGMAAVL